MKDRTNQETVHFANRPLGEPYACGLMGYPNGPAVPNSDDPEFINGCVIREAEATVLMATTAKNLVAIFMECGCEVTTHAPKTNPGVVMAPQSCVDHGGYSFGEGPRDAPYHVIVAGDDEVRRASQETEQKFGTE